MAEKSSWKGTTFGTVWMHEHLVKALRFMDVRLLYLFTALFVVPVCMIINHKNTAIIFRYLHQRIGYSRFKASWKTYTNHCLFAQVVVDKFAMYAGKRFNVKVEGYEHYLRLAEKGYVQLSAHVGNYEIAGYTLTAKQNRFNALVFGGEKNTVMMNRNKLFADTHIRMIPIQADGSHVFVLNEALSNHEIVSMPADRIIRSRKTITLPFLGADASFPLGPFSVATMRDQDVLAVNVMKTSLRGYTIYVTPLSYDHHADRNTQRRQLAQSYVACLEETIRQHPTQWYNYFEFWK